MYAGKWHVVEPGFSDILVPTLSSNVCSRGWECLGSKGDASPIMHEYLRVPWPLEHDEEMETQRLIERRCLELCNISVQTEPSSLQAQSRRVADDARAGKRTKFLPEQRRALQLVGPGAESSESRTRSVHTKPATAQPPGRVARARADERASG